MTSLPPDLIFRFWGCLGSFLLLTAAYTLGSWCVRSSGLFSQDYRQPAQLYVNGVLSLTLGYDLLAWGALIGSYVGAAQPVWHLGALITLAALGWWRAAASLRPASLWPGNWRGLLLRHSGLATVGGLAIAPACGLPESWDELVYHAELPKRWLHSQQLFVFPDLPYSAFPSLVEINGWLVASLDLFVAPRLMPAIFWGLGLGLAYACLRLYLSHTLALTFTLAWGLSETVLLIATGGYVEPVLMTNAWLILFLMLHKPAGSTTRSLRPAWILGVLLGGCAATKLTGGALALPALLAWWYRSRFPVQQACARQLQGTACLLAVAALFVVPFYLRAGLSTGNPLYPYYDTWFSHDPARVATSQFHHAIGGERFGLRGLAAWCLSPVLLGIDRAVYDGTFGYQQLAVLAVVIVGLAGSFRQRAWTWPLVSLSLSFTGLYTAWYLTAQQARFAIPAMFCGWLLAASLLERAAPRIKISLGVGMAILAMVSAPWPTTNFYLGGWFANLGLISGKSLLEQATGAEYLELVDAINGLTPAESRLLLVLEQRGFYMPRQVVIGTPFFQSYIFTPPEDFATGQAVIEALSQHRITHVVLASRPLGPDIPEVWAERFAQLGQGLEQAAAAGQLKGLWYSSTYQLLEVVQP